MIDKSIELRRNIWSILENFWAENQDVGIQEIFYINSVVSSSIMAQLIYMMFKKEGEESFKAREAYIDQIAKLAKEQLRSGHIMNLIGVKAEQ